MSIHRISQASSTYPLLHCWADLSRWSIRHIGIGCTMVDLCQWRASIGLWNCSQTRCQMTSSKPSKGHCFHSFSFRTTNRPSQNVDHSTTWSTFLKKASFNLPLKFYFFTALLLLLPIFSLSFYIKLESRPHHRPHFTSGIV